MTESKFWKHKVTENIFLVFQPLTLKTREIAMIFTAKMIGPYYFSAIPPAFSGVLSILNLVLPYAIFKIEDLEA